MKQTKRSRHGDALTDLILEVFRLNGRLLGTGDQLVASLGLSSARWQVLGAIALADMPQPVAWIARNMGLTRQGVQRTVNELLKDGLVELAANPHHRRSHLVVLTPKGKATFNKADQLQGPWADSLAKGFTLRDLNTASKMVTAIRERLELEHRSDKRD